MAKEKDKEQWEESFVVHVMSCEEINGSGCLVDTQFNLFIQEFSRLCYQFIEEAL